MPGLTRAPGKGGPRIVQQPLLSGLRPMITMVIAPLVIHLESFISVLGSESRKVASSSARST